MWSAKITEVTKNKASLNVTVEFYLDGGVYDTQTLVVSDVSSIQRIIIDQVNQFKKIVDLDLDSIKGDVDLTPPSPIVPPPPSPEEIEAKTLAQEVYKLNQLKKAISNGIITASNPTYVATLASVKAKYKDSLINIL